MLPGRVSNPGPLTYGSGVLPIALRGPALREKDEIAVAAQKKEESPLELIICQFGLFILAGRP